MIWAAERRPRWSGSRQGGLSNGDAPPIFFSVLPEKKTGRARSKRKGRWARSGAVALRARRGSAYRCKRRFCPAFGHAWVFYEFATAVPCRRVRWSTGCKDAFGLLLFPRVPLRYALPWRSCRLVPHKTESLPRPRRGRCPHRPVAEASINHQASGSENRRGMYPRLPRAKGLPRGSAFPSLTAARDRQPSPAGGRRSALAQTDPPNIFSFPPGAAHLSPA